MKIVIKIHFSFVQCLFLKGFGSAFVFCIEANQHLEFAQEHFDSGLLPRKAGNKLAHKPR